VADLTITIDADELLGLTAVAAVSEPAEGSGTGVPGPGVPGTDLPGADLPGTAKALLRAGLAVRLDELGLPWAPSPETLRSYEAEAAADSAAQAGFLHRLAADVRVRKYGGTALLVAFLIALWGGYVMHWQWTGFAANDQLWDWLRLLLLPVAVGTLPLWIQNAGYISPARRAAYAAAIAAFGVFVAVGYLVPWKWTGFQGNTLWDWFELVLLPAAIVSLRAWSAAGRSVRSWHKAGLTALMTGWLITLVGGYDGNWRWTGYQGNTLWDWLQLLLLPLVFPTILLPAMLRWITGNAEERAEEEAKKAKGAPPGSTSLAKA
jgi:hypothetical protein